MKNILFLISFLTCLNVTGQSSIEIEGGFNYLFDQHSELIQDQRFLEGPAFVQIQPLIGVNYIHQLSENWYVKSGLRFTRLGYTHDVHWATRCFGLPRSSSSAALSSRKAAYLEMPMLAGFNISSEEGLHLFTEFGISYYKYLHTQFSDQNAANEPISGKQTFPHSRNLIAISAGGGIGYSIAQRIQLRSLISLQTHLREIDPILFISRHFETRFLLALRYNFKPQAG